MKYFLFFALVCLIQTTQSGCSYLVNGPNDKISVNCNSLQTNIYLNDQPIGKGFASASVKRGEKYLISGKTDGCVDAKHEVQWKINAIAAISFVTLPIDLALGTAWEPTEKSILLNPACNTL